MRAPEEIAQKILDEQVENTTPTNCEITSYLELKKAIANAIQSERKFFLVPSVEQIKEQLEIAIFQCELGGKSVQENLHEYISQLSSLGTCDFKWPHFDAISLIVNNTPEKGSATISIEGYLAKDVAYKFKEMFLELNKELFNKGVEKNEI